MVESWCGFRVVFTSAKATMASTDFGSLQKEFLGAIPMGLEGVKRLALQKVKEITPLVALEQFQLRAAAEVFTPPYWSQSMSYSSQKTSFLKNSQSGDLSH